ncbi:MAG: alpha/beta fold hydrolase [Anaerolineales bacterium]|nr:alpha/beta fold hydrolase [Anaerolineales bacterium]
MKPFRLLSALCLIGLVVLSVRPAQAQSADPAFEPTFTQAPCMFELSGQRPPEELDVVCGYVTVPEQHAVPDGPTIEIAVAIIPVQATSTGELNTLEAASDPLFVAQGGPGGSTINFFGEAILEYGDFADIGREIVLIEQRGTYYSKPNLLCADEEIALLDELLEEVDLTDEQYEQRALASEQACRNRLLDEGVNLAAYNSLENAADMESVRQALGYEGFNFYGVSYGTLLGLHLMRDYPEHLRSVILDAVVPTQTPFLAETARSSDRAFDELFATCAADAECAAAFPNLEERFYNLVAELNENPAPITLTDDETGQVYDTIYTGDDLISTLFSNLYVTSALNSLPLIIYQIEQGRMDYVELDLSFRIFDRTFSTGMYNSVICAEDYDMPREVSAAEGIHPFVLQNKQESIDSFLKSCERWGVPPLEATVNLPVQSDIPTLVLSGQFDPITPPSFGETAAATLPNSYAYTLPATGHGAATDSDCAVQIVRQFLTHPTQEPLANCIDSVAALDFVTPAEYLPTNVAWLLNSALINIDEGDSVASQLLYPLISGGSLLILLTVFFFWPISYLAEKMRDEPIPRRTTWVKLAGWLTALNTVVMIIFAAGVVWAIFYTYLEVPEIALFGITPLARPLFILPYMITILLVLMLVSMVSAWRTNAWSAARRLYYTMLTGAAVVYVVIMGLLGFYTVLL